MARPKDISEAELVAGCLRQDRYHQEQFYRRFAPGMLRMCLRYTRDEELALDIVNRGMLRVFLKLDQYGFKGSLEGWVRRLVFHALSDHFRNQKTKMHFLELEERDAPLPQGVLSRLYLEDLLQLAEKLPDLPRQVFYLYAIEGYTHKEIGEQLGIPEGSSKWHLSKARKALKQLIKTHYLHAV